MYTPIRRECANAINEMASPRTPDTSMSFSRELRQVLQERSLLTAKSRSKVCSMLVGRCDKSPVPPYNTEIDKRRQFRMQAVHEIASTERTYLNQLEIMMKYFVKPLKEHQIIDKSSHTTLFGQIEMIYNLNLEFLKELESDMDNIASAFLKMAPFFKLYSVYAFDYRQALLLLQDLQSKNAAFRKFLLENEYRPEVERKLDSLMIVPIQRVMRYKLLLEQVLLYTSPADADFKLLKESIKQIESTVSHINTCVEDQEVTQLLINIQNSLVNRTPNIVKPSRRVIKEGVLSKITRNGEEIKRYCVLTSDIFMYCKILKERAPKTLVENSLECCCIFPLNKCKVYDLLPGNFKLTCQCDGIIFGALDIQEARVWVDFIRDAIDMHIQGRKTLRKESSHRVPLRKREVKNFGEDYMLSPKQRKLDYETIFHNKNRESGDESDNKNLESHNEAESDMSLTWTCFGDRKRKLRPKLSAKIDRNTRENVQRTARINSVKRKERQMPKLSNELGFKIRSNSRMPKANLGSENRLSKLYKRSKTGRILKNSLSQIPPCQRTQSQDQDQQSSQRREQPRLSDNDASYGFASRYSDSKSYFKTHNVDTLPSAVKREDLLQSAAPTGSGWHFRDTLFPLRSSNGSDKSNLCMSDLSNSNNWVLPSSGQGNYSTEELTSPPQKKRVKFDDSSNTSYMQPAFEFSRKPISGDHAKPPTLRQKIYDFFAKLF